MITNIHKKLSSIAIVIFLAWAGGIGVEAAPAVPAGFEVQTVASGLSLPIAAEFAPDGRIFIAEKAAR